MMAIIRMILSKLATFFSLFFLLWGFLRNVLPFQAIYEWLFVQRNQMTAVNPQRWAEIQLPQHCRRQGHCQIWPNATCRWIDVKSMNIKSTRYGFRASRREIIAKDKYNIIMLFIFLMGAFIESIME